jgi:crossover junction endodeoxyribonuclease RuvC
MIYIGIDPGKKGAYAWYTDGVMRVRQWDDNYFAQDMHLLAAMDDRLVACVEKVGAMPGQGVTSMFSFGQSFGFILGVLTAFGIPYQLVPPRKWKAEYGLLNTQKQASVDVAKRLFPEVSLLPTERCRKESDGMSDAVLMAEYARRKF